MNVKRITTEHDLHTAFDIRKTVFVEEQGCPVSDEFDEFDTLHGDCQHILVYMNNSRSAQRVCVSLITRANWKESAF